MEIGPFIIFKNKGFLVFIYSIVCLIIVSSIIRGIEGYFEIQLKNNLQTGLNLGISTIISGILTWFSSNDYIKLNGEKQISDFDNEFFFIPMKTWSYILIVFGILSIISAILD